MAWGRGEDHALRQRLGITLQETKLQEKLTVIETLRLFRSFYDQGKSAEEAMALVSLDEYEEAAALFAKALEFDPDGLTLGSQRSAQMASAYGRLLTTMGRYDEAESRLLAALGVLERDVRPDDPRARRTRAFLAELYDAWGRPAKAVEYRAQLAESEEPPQ